MAHSEFKGCKALKLTGVVEDISRKKSGRIASIRLMTEQGSIKFKASKYLRVSPGYRPSGGDIVKLKALRKVKAGRTKLKAFELAVVQTGSLPKLSAKPMEISLCKSSGCRKRGADKLRAQLEKVLSQSNEAQIRITTTKCLGKCKSGPVAKVRPSGRVYSRLDVKTILKLLSQASRAG